MPDLEQFSERSTPVRMYAEPHDSGLTDTLMYFRLSIGKVNTVVEIPHSSGTNTVIVCSGPYTLDEVGLSVRWTQGPLNGLRELLKPIDEQAEFVKFKSDYREFWLKIK